jgi:hypothetical protein
VLTPAVFALLCLLPGLPLAGALARRRSVPTASGVLVAEALAFGLAWYLLLGTVLARNGQLGRAQLLVPTFVLALAVAVLARPVWPRIRVTRLGLFVAVAFVVGAALRTKPAYFIYQIGDFGEYVNRGNVLADGGPFIEWFTQGYSILLALSHVTLGEARTVDIQGFLGLVVMALVLAVTTRLGATVWARGVLAVVFAIGVVPVWFSNFPASETLYALLLVAFLHVVVTAVEAHHLPTAATGAVFAFLLLLTRGNGVLLMPMVLGVVLLVAPFVERATMRVLVVFGGTAMVGFYAAFVYNSRFSYPYFITDQMPRFFPERVWRRFDDLGGLRAASWKGVIFALGVAAVLAAAWQLNRLRPLLPAAVRAAVVPLVLLVAALWIGHNGSSGVREGLDHYDGAIHLLGVVAVVGAVVVFARRLDDHARVGLIFALLVGAAAAWLHSYRFHDPREAPYYLYWDRYLWSEFFPMVMVLASLGMGLLVAAARRWRPLGIGLLVVAAVGTVTMWNAGSLSREQRFMGHAYRDLAEVSRLTGDRPIVFSGVDFRSMTGPVSHPNSFRLFATPLTETFGRRVLNIAHLTSYRGDPRPTVEEARALLRQHGYSSGAFVQVLERGESPMPGLQVDGTVDVTIPMLNRPIWHQPTHWRNDFFRVVVGTL